MDLAKKYFLVSGKVQGVSFRYFTLQTAMNMNIKGWVRNLRDGRVEGVAVAHEEACDSFFTKLKLGPDKAEVSEIRVIDLDEIEDVIEFDIKETEDGPWHEI